MKFANWNLDDDTIERTKLYKEIENNLGGIVITDINDNVGRVFKNPTSGEQAKIFFFMLETGTKLGLYIAKDGRVTRVELDDKVFDSALVGKEVTLTPQSLGGLIKKHIFAEQKQEALSKINDKDFAKLSSDDGSLATLKSSLTKGSGKFVVFNDNGEMYGKNGFTSVNSEIEIFNSIQEAQTMAGLDNKIARI
ncbi:MAG: hypothetical protein ACWGHH_06590 [Sulfurovaceae bacterium]